MINIMLTYEEMKAIGSGDVMPTVVEKINAEQAKQPIRRLIERLKNIRNSLHCRQWYETFVLINEQADKHYGTRLCGIMRELREVVTTVSTVIEPKDTAFVFDHYIRKLEAML